MSNLVIMWREYKLAPTEEDDAYLFDDGVLYIGVAKETDSTWGACIAVGALEVQGFGISAHAALDTALADLLSKSSGTEDRIRKAFP